MIIAVREIDFIEINSNLTHSRSYANRNTELNFHWTSLRTCDDLDRSKLLTIDNNFFRRVGRASQ